MVGWVPSITSISDVVYPRITKNISSDIYPDPALLLGTPRYAGVSVSPLVTIITL